MDQVAGSFTSGRPGRVGWIRSVGLAAILVVAGCTRPAAPAAGQTWETQGPIRWIDGQTWIVGDRLVTVGPGADVSGRPAVGASARVAGTRAANGQILVERVTVTDQDRPTPTPTAARPAVPPTPPPTVRPPAPTPAGRQQQPPATQQNKEQNKQQKPDQRQRDTNEEDDDD